MADSIVDLSYLYSLADDDSNYIYEVLSMYMTTAPETMQILGEAIEQGTDFTLIAKKAHLLKSSASIVKVKDMYDKLVTIELLARNNSSIAEIRTAFQHLKLQFDNALPVLLEIVKKHAPAH